MGLSASAVAQGPPGNNPGQPFEQLASEHAGLATQLGNVPTNAEMSAQHDMIQQDIADVETNLGAQIQEVKELVEGMNGGGGNEFPCTSGTPVGTRWVVSDTGRTVCDKITNKAWEQHPTSVERNWDDSIAYCQSLGAGWELPPREILESLVDTNNSNPALPTGDPFTNVQSSYYWSATSHADFPANAWSVFFVNGDVNFFNKEADDFPAWCVRAD